MSEEVEVVAEVTPAPEQVATAAPETAVVETPEAEVTPKSFTQEELDAAISKRLAREQRKWAREQAMQAAQAVPQQPLEIPPMEQFESPDAYAEALAYKKAHELIQQREMQRMQVETLSAYHEREEVATERYADFKQVAYGDHVRITQVMADTIRSSEVGPDVAYYLGSNPAEAAKIADLPPFLQAKEIGRLEAKMMANPPVKRSTSAPPPIAPVSARGAKPPAYDTTDPRSIKTMSTSEWIEADRRRQMAKWEAQHR
jgi:hypothetical protein